MLTLISVISAAAAVVAEKGLGVFKWPKGGLAPWPLSAFQQLSVNPMFCIKIK